MSHDTAYYADNITVFRYNEQHIMLVELKISALLQTAETDINMVVVLYHVTDESSQVLL